ncbi:MAG: XdhC family protein [Planctomycetaceae bacterium]|nr:XdhC family protein [Planctomycetaceae bacterium]
MHRILRELIAAADAGRAVVYTSLVETRGSTPQKAGAAMLVFDDGSQVGTLGGGCVEAEVKRRALKRLDGGRPELLTFQLDHDYGWDDGLICGGRMTMLVHPLSPMDDRRYFQAFHDAVERGRGCTAAVLIDEERFAERVGEQFLFDAEGDVLATTGAEPPPGVVRENLRALSVRPRPYVDQGISYLPVLPRCRLLIVGGGHVGQKVAALAHDVDFDVWVVDDREQYCNADRFPHAERRIVGPIAEMLSDVEVDDQTFCIIVTRGHNHDEEALALLAPTAARFVGMIGSKRKIRLIFDDLRRDGLSEDMLARVRAPIGFDIGSQTVSEIAVSIVAELIAARNLPQNLRTEHSFTRSV